jgi:hypothetical protein
MTKEMIDGIERGELERKNMINTHLSKHFVKRNKRNTTNECARGENEWERFKEDGGYRCRWFSEREIERFYQEG